MSVSPPLRFVEHEPCESRVAAQPRPEPMIEAKGVGKVYYSKTSETWAIGDITTTIGKGEFVSIVGPSGCGKSTFLHIIAGFTQATKGEISLLDTGRGKTRLGYIFQKDTVLPWYTVRKNVGLGPAFNGVDRKIAKAKIDALLEMAHLSDFADAYPHQLSGGMRRRVALLMGLANDPEILLLDEPFGALDTHTKTHLHRELIEIWRKLNQTVVMVTHDLDEAITLSDRVIVLSSPPSRILLDECIDIPHPRDVFTVRQSELFTQHFNRIWTVLGQQFQASE
ncbi:NitT/TauT family transport system ATP-binding protein [Rhodoligotrophos appendicifer]|uniref:ABC transporter ATP-binding protein n=1 Tax=Rhodoligotrophos appendicifer TaxID=987056 RepID=UPI001FEAD1D8|nr:ABC transporter ATP-binding protein [Rhodoligotrophos appendicifer]